MRVLRGSVYAVRVLTTYLSIEVPGVRPKCQTSYAETLHVPALAMTNQHADTARPTRPWVVLDVAADLQVVEQHVSCLQWLRRSCPVQCHPCVASAIESFKLV